MLVNGEIPTDHNIYSAQVNDSGLLALWRFMIKNLWQVLKVIYKEAYV